TASWLPTTCWPGSTVAFTVTGVAPAASPEVTSTVSQGAPVVTVKLTMLPYTSSLVTAMGCAAGAGPPTTAEKASFTGTVDRDPAVKWRIHALRPKVPATSACAARWYTSA